MASTTRPATGSTSWRQAGSVSSIQPGAGPGLGGAAHGGQAGDAVQPQVGQPARLDDLGGLGGGDRAVRRARGGGGHLGGEVPVDRAAGPAQQLLQLSEHAREVAPTRAHAAQEPAEAERVVASPAGLVRVVRPVGGAEAERRPGHARTTRDAGAGKADSRSARMVITLRRAPATGRS
jgi:hypothetical protein